MRALVLLGLCSGCMSTEAETWTLVWADEFDGDEGTPPSAENWVADVGGDGWGNNQLEHNTDRTENAALDGAGHLVITARQEDYEGNAYTSARLKSQDLQEFAYGRIEARIKLPAGPGLWPAFWMLGADFPEIGWPACGEIDILEMRGSEPDRLIGTVHGPGYSGGDGVGDSVKLIDSLAEDFHVYAIEWDPEHIAWYLDDEVFHTLHPGNLPENTVWVFDHPFFLILNLAVGGNFVEPPSDPGVFPAQMSVDHVRVYERTHPLEDPVATEE